MINGRALVPVIAAMLVVMRMSCSPAVAAGNATEFDVGDNRLGDRSSIVPSARPMPPLPAVDGETSTDAVQANPLWGIPVDALHATRERPLFSPSRRPPAPVAVSAPVAPPVKPVAPATIAAPTLSLLGIVAGKDEAFAVFINTTTHDIVRLKTGEGDDGWILRSVSGREAVIEKDHRTEILKLPPILGVSK